MARNHDIRIRLDSEEKTKIEKKAEELGLTIMQYIRMCSLKGEFKVLK